MHRTYRERKAGVVKGLRACGLAGQGFWELVKRDGDVEAGKGRLDARVVDFDVDTDAF